MYKALSFPALILVCSSVAAGNDIWQSLFDKKLVEASQGNSNAQYDVGAMYQNGRGVTTSRDKAIEWYKKAAAQNNNQASLRLGLMRANEERFTRELSRAEKGNAESQFSLANMYTKGVGIKADHEQALTWYGKAAAQGHLKAGYKIGQAYLEGSGITKNRKQAFKWFESAATNNYPPAQYYLGQMYSDGLGVKRNYARALEWYGKALDGGFTQAHDEIASITAMMSTDKQPRTMTPGKAVSYSMDDLLHTTWKRGSKPVGWLPSAVNDCSNEGDRLVCSSEPLLRESDTYTIHYKTRAIIDKFTADGSFTVVYRNLVIEATPAMDAVIDSEKGTGNYTIKTGWGSKHSLECHMQDSVTVNCLKNNTHQIVLSSPQTLAENQE